MKQQSTIIYGHWSNECGNERVIPNSSFAQQIGQLILQQYNNTPQTGKPQSHKQEWTMLAGVIMCEQKEKSYTLSVVSLGTGTKCLGFDLFVKDGSLVHDSHAEVIARRGFMNWLYDQIDKCLGHQPSVLVRSDDKSEFIVKDEISFHFFVNQSPCGDASIHDIADQESSVSPVVVNDNNKRPRTDDVPNSEVEKKQKTVDSHGRTGARPVCRDYVPGTETDREVGDTEQKTGIVRTKPGRGPRTISMSCSDKISKWNVLGVQGSLLSNFIPQPIKFATISIGSTKSFYAGALLRAFDARMTKQDNLYIPYLLGCDIEFPDGKSDTRVNACSFSMSYVAPDALQVLIGHRGHRLGLGKQHLNKPKCWSTLSQYKLFERFCSLYSKCHSTEVNCPYNQAKQLAIDYCKRRQQFLEQEPFSLWVVTDHDKYYNFTILNAARDDQRRS